MSSILSILWWWVLALVLGILTFPIAFRLFKALPDRGLGFSKLLGLLLSSYAVYLAGFVWLGTPTIILAWVGLAWIAWRLYVKDADELRAFVNENAGLWLVYEALFFFLFFFWAVARMRHPNILDQEKFMDFAFFNALSRTSRMPPYDPWLAAPDNYINYYYYGYFVMASFAKLSGVAAAYSYNLVIALVFALSGGAIFSLSYNLTRALWPGFAGVAALQFLGNLDGGLQLLRGRGFDWWAPTRLIKDVAKVGPKGPTYLNHWWHSANPQVLQANGLTEAAARDGLISEFPIFSFIHGDMHPHFTAIPFVLLVLGLVLALVKSDDKDVLDALQPTPKLKRWSFALLTFAIVAGLLGLRQDAWMLKRVALSGMALALVGVLVINRATLRVDRLWFFGALVLALGTVFMANTWDAPAYGLAAAAGLLAQQHLRGRSTSNWSQGWLLPGLALLAGMLLVALPFLAFFSNPAQGLGFSRAKTGLHDTLIFWGLFLAVLLPFVITRVLVLARALADPGQSNEAPKKMLSRTKIRACRDCGSRLRAGKVFCPQCGARNEEQAESDETQAPNIVGDLGPIPALPAVLLQFFQRPALALAHPVGRVLVWVWIGLLSVSLLFWPTTAVFLLLASLAALLIAARGDSAEALYVLALIMVAAALVMGVEWFYLRDVFEGNTSLTRMNTVFKFYFQAWILFSVALPFALWWTLRALLRLAGDLARTIYLSILAIVALGALVYPVRALGVVWDDFDATQNMLPTLDGSAWLRRDTPGDWSVIQRLRAEVKGAPVILEAVGGAYTHFARVSSYTGLPTVVGWGNHESQWRKQWPTQQEVDVNEIYNTQDLGKAQSLLAKYGVTYIFCGSLERQKYGQDALNKFASFADIAFQDQGTVVYKLRGR